jgi:alkyl hydroperoxide reductase subunit AhpF
MRRRHLVAAATLLAAAAPLTPGPHTTLTGRPRLAALNSAPANGANAPQSVNGAAAPQNDIYDVAICGAGPAGLATAAECAARGLKVCVADPALGRDWPNNYGVWIDEVEPLGFDDCVDVSA